MEPEAGPRKFLIVITSSGLQRGLETRAVPATLAPTRPPHDYPTAPPELQGPAPSPSSTAKPILQSMAGNSIQEVTNDEWGPPADMEQTEGETAS